jgi:hypothetical protein
MFKHLMLSIGAAEDMAHSSLRFGIGRFTTEAEVDFVIQHIVRTVTRLREMRYGCCFVIALVLLTIAVAHCGRWFRRVLILALSTGRSIKNVDGSGLMISMFTCTLYRLASF